MQKTFIYMLTAAIALAAPMRSQVSAAPSVVASQAGTAAAPIPASVCQIAANPASFAGKVVRIVGPMVVNHVYTAIGGSAACAGQLYFGSGDTIEQTDALDKQFWAAIAAQLVPVVPNRNTCMYDSCPRYEVFAEMVGRIDYPVTELGNEAPRFELMQVWQVWTVELPFDPKILKQP